MFTLGFVYDVHLRILFFCRLCFVKDICSELKDITRLSQIAELEKKTMSMLSFFKQVKVLRIKGVGNEMG